MPAERRHEAGPGLVLRPGETGDLELVAEVYLAAREAAVPAMPEGVHPPDEVRSWVAGWDLGRRELWVAEATEVEGAGAGSLVGYAVLEGDWLDSLYVVPEAAGRGVGSALLDLAKQRRPEGFGLWVFESNRPARRFYRDRGLLELERTDGSGNEEQAPDIRMVWPGREPLRHLRHLIDDVDDQIGELLARRVALTRVVQELKRGPHRDPDREREIAERVARLVPELGPRRTARVMDAIIAASLDAVATGGGQDGDDG